MNKKKVIIGVLMAALVIRLRNEGLTIPARDSDNGSYIVTTLLASPEFYYNLVSCGH